MLVDAKVSVIYNIQKPFYCNCISTSTRALSRQEIFNIS